MNVLKISRSSKLLSVFGTSDGLKTTAGSVNTMFCNTAGKLKVLRTITRHTHNSEPTCNRSINLIHDDDDNKVDDSGSGFNGGSDISADRGNGTHVQGGHDGDSV